MRVTTWRTLLTVAFLSPLCAGYILHRNCTEEGLSITDGNYTLSKGMEVGSMLVYQCKDGYYPSPTLSRRCQRRGKWSPAPNIKQPAECKRVTCPNPMTFENVAIFPNEMKYYVDNKTTYECLDGYKQWGSKTRTCQSNGKWSGSTPICDSGSAHCPDPGVPPGARRTGHHFWIGDTVTYRCDEGLTLLGSKERVCQESREWTGMEPACYSKFTYDTPEEVTVTFAASLRNSLMSEDNKTQLAKKIHLNQGGNLHIYIALDYSDSIVKDNFDLSKQCIKKLIEKISFFDITPKYEILAFATDVAEIVNIASPNYEKLDILKELDNFMYDVKRDRSGTNIAGAFRHIRDKMSFLQASNDVGFKDIQHVIIMFTDGNANMGGSANPEVASIQSMLNIANNRQDYLGEDRNTVTVFISSYLGTRPKNVTSWGCISDIYVFGIGTEVNEDVIDKLVSKKPNENHFFKLKTLTSLEEMLDLMIDESDSVGLCGLSRDYDKGIESSKRQRHPWVAKVEITRPKDTDSCVGALVSCRFILTAAHCFKFDDKEDWIRVKIEDGKGSAIKKIKTYKPHPQFNLTKKSPGIKEFYDFDVALIELEEDVVMSVKARPICIPCTKETNSALKLSDKATCKEHEEILLKNDFESAQFMESKNLIRKNVTIKLNSRRESCVEDIKKAKDVNVTDANEIVTGNFLCTGGIEDMTNHVACKGNLVTLVEQCFKNGEDDSSRVKSELSSKEHVLADVVGVVSFGVKDLCTDGFFTPDSESSSRDYHINLFKVQPFLKQYLGDENQSCALKFID